MTARREFRLVWQADLLATHNPHIVMARVITDQSEETNYTVEQLKGFINNFSDVNTKSVKSAKTIAISSDTIKQIMDSGNYGAIKAEFARESPESDDHFLLVYGVKDMEADIDSEEALVFRADCPSSACP